MKLIPCWSKLIDIDVKMVPCRFKFDDERVTKEKMKTALEEQYGGEEEVVFPNALNLCSLFFCYVC